MDFYQSITRDSSEIHHSCLIGTLFLEQMYSPYLLAALYRQDKLTFSCLSHFILITPDLQILIRDLHQLAPLGF